MSGNNRKLGQPVDRPGQTWEELVIKDTREVPEFLRQNNYRYLGSEPLGTERYTSAEFFRLEVERMWPRVWQVAAREEDMLKPGDFVVYENVGRSYIVARQRDGSVKAFHNVCLHRGRRLKSESGHTVNLPCPYHGFKWNLDGTLNEIPCRWDFEHLTDEQMKLPEAQVGRWGGYIFIREEAEGPSIEEYLDPLPEHFKRWPHEQCTTSVWVAKVVHANWKATMEAFMEAWHNFSTHPQITPFIVDSTSRYNIYSDHVNLALSPMGVMSTQLDPADRSQQWIVDAYLKFNGIAKLQNNELKADSQKTARQVLAERARADYTALFGHDLSHASDAELLDAIYYAVFPNFHPWGGFMPSISYRFRPWPDQTKTLMEVRILTRVPPGKPIPPSVPMHMLKEGESWTASAIGEALGKVLDQDMTNIEEVQKGLEVSKNREVQLGDYMEIRMRHFHQTLDKYLQRK
jgi:phenylpropionate dioxygenase-like ring-hydroxylating dioxygenase large terminal subunit